MPTLPQDHVTFLYSTSKNQAMPVAHIHLTLLHSQRGANLLWNLLKSYLCLTNLSVYDVGTLASDDLMFHIGFSSHWYYLTSLASYCVF